MRIRESPFLHREVRAIERGDAIRADRDRLVAQCTLEKLRYRWWVRQGTLGRFMQPLGNFGRKYFGFLDPRQTGGGWW